MAKKLDQKAAVLAAAMGSGAVFEALNDDTEVQAPAAKADEPVAEPAPPPIEKEAPTMNAQTFAPAMDFNAVAERAKALFDGKMFDGNTMFDGKSMMERTQRMASEAAELARGNVEAMAASAKIAAQNAGTIGQDVAAAGRKGFGQASEAIKGFAEAKSPTELLELQSAFARTYMDTMIAEGARLSETFVKLAGEAMEPVSTRFAANAEKVKTLGN